jgi:nitrile hydratase subunit alpha
MSAQRYDRYRRSRPTDIKGAFLKTFDLHTGAPKGSFAFGSAKSMCNDIAGGTDGAAYATDSFTPNVYCLNPEGTAFDIWATDPLLAPAKDGVGLDGIAFGPDGNLYVTTFIPAGLFKISVTDGKATRVTALKASRALDHTDGMRSFGDGFLLIEGAGRLDKVTIKEDAAEIEIIQDGFVEPVAVTVVGSTGWVAEGKSSFLFGANKGKDPGPFTIKPSHCRSSAESTDQHHDGRRVIVLKTARRVRELAQRLRRKRIDAGKVGTRHCSTISLIVRGMSDHDHHADHNHSELSETELRVRALETVLTEKGYLDPPALDAIIQAYETKIGPHNGAQVVAKAWADPAFKEALLADATKAVSTLGYVSRVGDHLVAVENTPNRHNMVVCTLCSCYPWEMLGLPPVWYKAAPYRSRAVKDPRGVLADFGVTLPKETEIRVWDSTAETRFLVLPMRPPGTEGLSEQQLAELVTRDSMIGTGFPKTPGAPS